MKCRRDVYCEKEFLELCFTKGEAGIIASDDYEEYKLWRCLEKLILSSDVKLHLNKSKNQLFEIHFGYSNPLEMTFFEQVLFVVWSMCCSGELRLYLSDFTLDDVLSKMPEDENLTTIYLSCQSKEKCQQLMDESGIWAICPENIRDFKHFLNDYGSTVYRTESKGLEELAERLSPIPVLRWLTIDCRMNKH